MHIVSMIAVLGIMMFALGVMGAALSSYGSRMALALKGQSGQVRETAQILEWHAHGKAQARLDAMTPVEYLPLAA